MSSFRLTRNSRVSLNLVGVATLASTLTVMTEFAARMIRNSIFPAEIQATASLADLYAKLLTSTGFASCASAKNREELEKLVEQMCRENKLWVISDSQGPITLGHYDPESKTIIGIVTRANKERQGYGARMLNSLAHAEPLAKIHPVTRSGEALASSCGFTPMVKDQSTWMRCNCTCSSG
jgi:hypothetical protein